MELILLLGAAVAAAYWYSTSTTEPLPERPGRYFTWDELTESGTARRLGLSNRPTADAARRLMLLTAAVLDPLRAIVGPVAITSGYRSPRVNAHVHGAAETSQHMRGEAVDLKVPGMTARDVALVLIRSGIPFDQLIWYHPSRGGHVHVSYTQDRPNRRDIRWAPPDSTSEVPWTPPTPPAS